MLTVDKDLAKRVIHEIDVLAREDSSSQYVFENFCRDHNLLHDNDKILRSGDLFICCPFHHDESPSLGIDEDKRYWNCLGCSKHGRFVDFVMYYNRDIEGRDISFYQQVNELLKADPELQARVGAQTIYKSNKVQESFKGIEYEKFRIKQEKPKTYLELANFLKRKKYDTDMVIFSLLQMQSGVEPSLIYDSITNGTLKSIFVNDGKDDAYDIDAMLQEDKPADGQMVEGPHKIEI